MREGDESMRRPTAGDVVFLGGTCAGSKWREELKPGLICGYFDPMVEEWSDTCYENELVHMEKDDFLLWVMTPESTNFLSYAEITDNAHRYPDRFCYTFLPEYGGKTFSREQIRALRKIGFLVERAGGQYFEDYREAFAFFSKED